VNVDQIRTPLAYHLDALFQISSRTAEKRLKPRLTQHNVFDPAAAELIVPEPARRGGYIDLDAWRPF
jgi:hypothetical protein